MMILGIMYMLCLQQFNELQIREGKNGTNIVHEHELYTVIIYIYIIVAVAAAMLT
jgi:hypothetical protein